MEPRAVVVIGASAGGLHALYGIPSTRAGVDDRPAVVRGPRENGLRPAIDALFRSATRYQTQPPPERDRPAAPR